MTLPARLAEIEARVKRWNTPGLWERADFVVGARDDLAFLLAAVREATAHLEFYANAEHVMLESAPAKENVCPPYGHYARQGLARLESLAKGEV